MWRPRFALFCVVLWFSFSTVQAGVVESLKTVPDGWVQSFRAEPNALLKLRLAINLPQQAPFEKRLVNIATPGHLIYGKHMTRDQVNGYLFPPPQASAALASWLKDSGISSEQIRNDGHWITWTATVAQAEAMLSTQYFYWVNGGRMVIRTLEYSVPDDLRPYISMIQPTTRFGQARPHFDSIIKGEVQYPNSSVTYNTSDCNSHVTPSCLRSLYRLGNFSAIPNDGNRLGISGFLKEYAQYDDWSAFAAQFDSASASSGHNFSVELVNGGLNTQHELVYDSSEANLDIQYTLSLSRGTPVTYYSTAGRGPLILDPDQNFKRNQTTNEPYLEELHYLLSLPDDQLPSVLSTSYGEDEQSVPRTFAENVCFLLAQLGARGVSVIFSSGDSGVGQSCLTNDGTNSTRFLPIFPASCPFVTSVGGTTGINPEKGVYFSSGGFSNIWPRPDWQQEAVGCYLDKLGNVSAGLYNRQGRGFPDVASQAVNFLIIDKGQVTTVHGTSASAPVFAAIISNVNSVLFSMGRPSLGFLNPFLYGNGRRGLTDIIDGRSGGCRGKAGNGKNGSFVPNAGFNATEGWDPVTGLGTPLWPGLVGAALFGHGL